MNLLNPEIRAALLANMLARRNAQAQGEREPDPVPVVRFFNPLGAATWLATELDEDDILFGLADLGLGCLELGSFSLRELQSLRLPFGLGIERDILFDTALSISAYVAAARQAGSILGAEAAEGTRRGRRGWLKSGSLAACQITGWSACGGLRGRGRPGPS